MGAPSKVSDRFCLVSDQFCLVRLQKVTFELTLEDKLKCPWWGRGQQAVPIHKCRPGGVKMQGTF